MQRTVSGSCHQVGGVACAHGLPLGGGDGSAGLVLLPRRARRRRARCRARALLPLPQDVLIGLLDRLEAAFVADAGLVWVLLPRKVPVGLLDLLLGGVGPVEAQDKVRVALLCQLHHLLQLVPLADKPHHVLLDRPVLGAQGLQAHLLRLSLELSLGPAQLAENLAVVPGPFRSGLALVPVLGGRRRAARTSGCGLPRQPLEMEARELQPDLHPGRLVRAGGAALGIHVEPAQGEVRLLGRQVARLRDPLVADQVEGRLQGILQHLGGGPGEDGLEEPASLGAAANEPHPAAQAGEHVENCASAQRGQVHPVLLPGAHVGGARTVLQHQHAVAPAHLSGDPLS
mmetsp:Transcript_7224/g.19369  ORF Transcript_7224/g.19369 Transcript_7224/m.19369 type:complete len:343 (-) Transcript_7224:154-1182(-)